MADVLLTHSYHLFLDRKQARKMKPYPPLGTLYAAALLREKGFSVALFDSMLENPEEEFERALAKHEPHIVVVYEDNFNFLTKMCLSRMREVVYFMLEKSKQARAITVVNGSDATDHCFDYLRRGFDYLLMGEAEWTLLELVQRLLAAPNSPADDICGLAYLDPQGQRVVRTAHRRLMPRLDDLPFPAWDLIDGDRYRSAWTQAHGYFSLNMVSSRGCPYHCNWCAKPIYGTSYNARSPEKVAEEMRLLKDTFNPQHLWFADDIFALKPRWTERLARAVRDLDAGIPFQMQSRVDLITPATARALARAGCAEVWMGAESGSQVEQAIQARQNLRAAGIRACFFLQFGYPGETWEDIRSTIDLVRRARPDDIGVSVSYPLPGTKFHSMVQEQLQAKTNWEDSEDLAMMFKGTYTDEFYHALHDALHLEVDLTRFLVSGNGTGNKGTAAEISGRNRSRELSSLWARVAELESRCRNANQARVPALDIPAGYGSQDSGFRIQESES
jgi:anaerobic magnesium-protoporphyrin IX monomethyl ester cyclase